MHYPLPKSHRILGSGKKKKTGKIIAPLGLYVPNCEGCCKPVQTLPERVLTGSKPVFPPSHNFQIEPLSGFVQFLSGLIEHDNLQWKNENNVTRERA